MSSPNWAYHVTVAWSKCRRFAPSLEMISSIRSPVTLPCSLCARSMLLLKRVCSLSRPERANPNPEFGVFLHDFSWPSPLYQSLRLRKVSFLRSLWLKWWVIVEFPLLKGRRWHWWWSSLSLSSGCALRRKAIAPMIKVLFCLDRPFMFRSQKSLNDHKSLLGILWQHLQVYGSVGVRDLDSSISPLCLCRPLLDDRYRRLMLFGGDLLPPQTCFDPNRDLRG